MNSQKVKFPIGLKLVIIVSTLVLMVLGLSTGIILYMVSDNSSTSAKDTNNTLNEITAETVNSLVVARQNNTLGFLNDALLSRSTTKVTDEMFDDFCFRNSDVWFISAPEMGIKTSSQAEIYNPGSKALISKWLETKKTEIENARKGEVSILNMKDVMNQSSICIIFPYEYNKKADYAAVGFNVSSIIDLISNSERNTIFIVNKDGEVLVCAGEPEDDAPYFQAAAKALSEAEEESMQVQKEDNDGNNWIISYKKIAGGMYSVTCISQSDITQMVRKTAYRIILITMAIIFLAILLIRHFSKTITRPIHALVGAAGQIQNGDYDVKLKAKTHDEIGLLTNRFVSMSSGLAERERLKDSMSRFTNKAIAEKAMKGELNLGGENRNVTIFFSDIRSFTAMSEKLTPAEVVEFLNEYMTKMVSCVLKTHGTVDKYIGDAIMAVWGAPESAGSPEKDAWNAVCGALMMRTELYRLNQKRKRQGKPVIKIGCGINSGSVVAGQIGSDERMEYTVIGDAVNLASRTEALNKPFQTDILITENTYNLIGDRLVVEEMPAVHVKGKENAIKMFAVINVKGVQGATSLNQIRNLLGFHEIDKSQVNTDEEEKKYKIGK